jgi:hypothetical protein
MNAPYMVGAASTPVVLDSVPSLKTKLYASLTRLIDFLGGWRGLNDRLESSR